METDTLEVLTEAIMLVRKGGTIAVVGDYYNNTNNYPIGKYRTQNSNNVYLFPLSIRCIHGKSSNHAIRSSQRSSLLERSTENY